MSMNKKVTIPMETTAYYQSESKLNVRFWSQDKNTAELRFLITRNDYPLSLSSENVKVFLTLKSGDSFISTDDVNIYNEVEGVATYIIPEEFMRVVNEVVGQVYVATLDGEEIVVQRKFSFTVENDLLSSIPSEEKLRYIKMFSDLQEEMSTRLGGVETALNQLESNVEEVNNAKQTGITAINNLYDAKLVTFNQNFDNKMASINNAIDDMENYVDTSLAYMTTKKKEFDSSVSGSSLVTTGLSSNWQKYKLTNDNGTLFTLNNFDFNDIDSLETGNYFLYSSNNSPFKGTSYGFLKIEKVTNNSKKAIATPGNSNQYYVKYKWNGTWSDWEELVTAKDSSQIETITESQNKANTAENNAKVYTDTKVSAQRAVLFSGSVNGVGQKIDLTESMDNYSILIVSGTYSGGRFDEVIVVSNIGSGHPIQRVNLSNPTATGAIIYETELTKDSSTRFNIIRDNYYGIASGEATMTANSFTIQKIEAIK